MKIAVLASTNGTNLPAFFSEAISLNISCILFTNKSQCGAVQKAKELNIPTFFIDHLGKTREEYDVEVLELLQNQGVEHIFCIGYMRIISPLLVQAFEGKIYNIHPSLLPSFAGGMDSDVHSQVLQKKCKVSGATLHIVSEEVDEGEILLQKSCEIVPNETPDSLKKKVQYLEKQMLISYLYFLKTGYFFKNYNSIIPAVYCIFEKNEKILLLKRANTGYVDGMFSFPAGHVEKNESFLDAGIREAKEEVGVDIFHSDCSVVHILNRKTAYMPERIDIFIKIHKWNGEIINAEPQKCEKIEWFSYDSLPSILLSFLPEVLKNIQKKVFYSEIGF